MACLWPLNALDHGMHSFGNSGDKCIPLACIHYLTAKKNCSFGVWAPVPLTGRTPCPRSTGHARSARQHIQTFFTRPSEYEHHETQANNSPTPIIFEDSIPRQPNDSYDLACVRMVSVDEMAWVFASPKGTRGSWNDWHREERRYFDDLLTFFWLFGTLSTACCLLSCYY